VKKILVVVLIAVLAVSVLSACAETPVDNPAPSVNGLTLEQLFEKHGVPGVNTLQFVSDYDEGKNNVAVLLNGEAEYLAGESTDICSTPMAYFSKGYSERLKNGARQFESLCKLSSFVEYTRNYEAKTVCDPVYNQIEVIYLDRNGPSVVIIPAQYETKVVDPAKWEGTNASLTIWTLPKSQGYDQPVNNVVENLTTGEIALNVEIFTYADGNDYYGRIFEGETAWGYVTTEKRKQYGGSMRINLSQTEPNYDRLPLVTDQMSLVFNYPFGGPGSACDEVVRWWPQTDQEKQTKAEIIDACGVLYRPEGPYSW
jgi:hypothetical protein